MNLEMELADRLYIFCPQALNHGLKFILQGIPDSVANFAGDIPNNTILCSNVEGARWNETVNGEIPEKVPYVGTVKKFPVNTVKGSYTAITIIVSRETLIDLLNQNMQNSKQASNNYNLYKSFDMTRVIKECKEKAKISKKKQ